MAAAKKDRAGHTAREEVPARALRFLHGIGTSKDVQARIGARYRREDHEEGWRLLRAASGEMHDGLDKPNHAYEDARAAILAWHHDDLAVARAAFTHHHPELAQRLHRLHDPAAPELLVKYLEVEHALDTFDALEKEGQRAALEAIAARGITPDARGRMRALLKVVQGLAPVQTEKVVFVPPSEDAVTALLTWFTDWSRIVREELKDRRDLLIHLGLAERRPTKEKA